MILVIDNYDSFVYNLQRYLVRLGQDVVVVRNDEIRLQQALAFSNAELLAVTELGSPAAIVISPGPKAPRDAGCCIELVKRFSGLIPVLGVCLGHQVIYEAFGGKVVRARSPMHGQSSMVQLGKSRLFAGIGDSVEFARYHSLVCDPQTLPDCLRVSATTDDQQIMAVEHQTHRTFGVQFHPESILSRSGYLVLQNFLRISGLPCADQLPDNDLQCQVSASQLITADQLANGKLDNNELGREAEQHAVVLPNQYRL